MRGLPCSSQKPKLSATHGARSVDSSSQARFCGASAAAGRKRNSRNAIAVAGGGGAHRPV